MEESLSREQIHVYIYETIGFRRKEIRKNYSKTGNELTRGERGNTSVMKWSKGVIQREKERKKRRNRQTGMKKGEVKKHGKESEKRREKGEKQRWRKNG